MTETESSVQSVPQVLLNPYTDGTLLSRAEAACLTAALAPRTRTDLEEHGFPRELVDAMLHRGLLAPAPAEADLWHRHGWGRPQALFRAAEATRAARAVDLPGRTAPLAGVLDNRAAVETALTRRSHRLFDRNPMPARALHTVLAGTEPLLRAWPHLGLYAAAQQVDGLTRGIHAYRSGTLTLHVEGLSDTRLGDCTHQYWVLGTGAVLFFTVDWHALEQAHGPGPDAYTTALVECGRLAHAAVLAAGQAGVGAWMTPAIDEQVAAELCGLDDTAQEALYMVKVGMPRTPEVTP